MRRPNQLGLLVSVFLVVGGAVPAQATSGAASATEPVLTCDEMVGQKIDVTASDVARVARVRSAATVAPSGSTSTYCELQGTIGAIRFTMRLPLSEWNGRYFQTGCGGFCGAVPIASCGQALGRGFAIAAEDTGHVGTGGDGTWAYKNRRAEIDFGYRSPHLMAQAGKALTETFYGQAPAYSYFQGCSTGGRQALSEVQRYPDDFDGVIAGAPALYQNYLAPLSQGYLETVNRRADGTVILTQAKARVLAAAVLAACDGPDGTVDGVIGDPDACTVDPAVVQCANDVEADDCLTAEQVRVARAFYAPPVDDKGRQVYPAGLVRGSEAGWPGASIGTDAALSGGGNYAQEVLRYLALPVDPGSDYSLFDFDPTTEARKLVRKAQIYNADDTDLRRFDESGGKLIVYHGWADPLITPGGTVNYVRDAMARSGGREATKDFMRLFLLPGVYHCSGGPGEDTVDWLTSIQQWVEQGKAPSQVTASKVAPDGSVTSTRVVPEYVPSR
ncbi:MAG: tannase/feruloyl esterase family alpha/beta hydrolase [Nocardioides sp.]|nr:tannase/feruloyl esterase family alpha/beta hydrolase [Nocardioides sp.]